MGGGEGRAESSQSEVEACGAFSQRGEGSTISTVFMISQKHIILLYHVLIILKVIVLKCTARCFHFLQHHYYQTHILVGNGL